MIEAKTKKGTKVYCCVVDDCESNNGGFYIEIYLDECGDRFDDFCVHNYDCDCHSSEEVEKFVKDYVSEITDY